MGAGSIAAGALACMLRGAIAENRVRDALAARGMIAPPLAGGYGSGLELGGVRLLCADMGRYFYIVVKWLVLAGYEITVTETLALRGTLLATYGRLVLEDPALRGRFFVSLSRWPAPGHAGSGVLRDSEAGEPSPLGRGLVISSGRGEQYVDLRFPYMMHPRLYLDGSHAICHRAALDGAGSDRPTRLFFAGNVSRDLYSKPVRFGGRSYVPRGRVVALTLEQPGVELLSDAAALGAPADGTRCAVLDASRCRIADGDWLGVLAKVDFFLAPPGVAMPFAHNIIEAMGAGAIPVTQYGDLFDPPLCHGINCLAYGPEDLGARIAEIRAMPAERVRAMRRAVLDYYSAHLSPEAFGAALRSGLTRSGSPLLVSFPYV